MKNNKIHYIALILLLSIPAVALAKTTEMKFTKEVQLENIGLKLKMMPDSFATPVPPPSAVTRKWSDGRTEEVYSPVDLWARTQHAGRWVDKSGNTIFIGILTVPFPSTVGEKMIPLKEFEEATSDSVIPGDEWTEEMITEWVKNYTGSENATAQEVKRKPFKFKTLIKYNFGEDEPRETAYVFRFNPSAAGQSRAPKTLFFLSANVSTSCSLERSMKSVDLKLIPSIKHIPMPAKTAKTASKKFQQSTVERKGNYSPEFIESRDRVAKSIVNMKDWWFVETENYIYISNLKSRYRVMVKELQENIEQMRFAYEQFVPPPKEISAISVIRIFATGNEYLSYVGPQYSWSGGLWMPQKKELVIRPIDWGRGKAQKLQVNQTANHEAFHQYLYYACDQLETHAWFNEGHAGLFQFTTFKNKKLTVLEPQQYIDTIIPLLGSRKPYLEELINADYKTYYTNNSDKLKQNYALCWAFIYYLRKYAPLEKPAKYDKILDKYIVELRKTEDTIKATELAFEGIDMNQLQKDYETFWKSKNKRGAAKRNKIFKDYKTSK